jgi:hypothetical protein
VTSFTTLQLKLCSLFKYLCIEIDNFDTSARPVWCATLRDLFVPLSHSTFRSCESVQFYPVNGIFGCVPKPSRSSRPFGIFEVGISLTLNIQQPDQKSSFWRFEVSTAVTMKNGVFWDVTPLGTCKNRRFGGT